MMKKRYISPALCKEVFETADVITASPLLMFNPNKKSGSDGLAKVNVSYELGKQKGVQ